MLQDIARPILEHLVIPFHMQDVASLLHIITIPAQKNLPKSIDMSCSPKKINPNHPKSSPNHIIEIYKCSTCFNLGPFSTPGVTPFQGSAEVHQGGPVPGPHGRVQQLGDQRAEDHLVRSTNGWLVVLTCFNHLEKY